MTHSSMTRPTTSPKSRNASRGVLGTLRLLSALLLLGLGAGVGVIVGMTVALFRPGVVDQPPLSQQTMQQTRHLLALLESTPNRASSPVIGAIPDASVTVSDRQLRILIPSDTLFEADQSSLQPTATQRLATLANQLKPYSGSSIRVSAYTNPQQNSEENRTLTFAQAKQVQQAIAPALGNDFSWFVVGVGASHLPDGAVADLKRSRWIEIIVTP